MREIAYFVLDEDSDISRLEHIATELRKINPNATINFQHKTPNSIPSSNNYSELRVAVIDGSSSLYTDPVLPDVKGLTYVVIGGESAFTTPAGRQIAGDLDAGEISDVINRTWKESSLVSQRAAFRHEYRSHFAIDGFGRVGESLAREILTQLPDSTVLIIRRGERTSKASQDKFEAGIRSVNYIPELGNVSSRVHVVSPEEAYKASFGVFVTLSDPWLRKNPVNDRVAHYVLNAPHIRKMVNRDMLQSTFASLPLFLPVTNYSFMIAQEMHRLLRALPFHPEVIVPPGGDVFRIREGLAAALMDTYQMDSDQADQKSRDSNIFVDGTHWHPRIRLASKIAGWGEHQELRTLDEAFTPQEIANINEWAEKKADDSFVRGMSADLNPGLIELIKRFRSRDDLILGAPFLVSKEARTIAYEPSALRLGPHIETLDGVDDTIHVYKYALFSTDNLGELKPIDPAYTDTGELRHVLDLLNFEHKVFSKVNQNLEDAITKIKKKKEKN